MSRHSEILPHLSIDLLRKIWAPAAKQAQVAFNRNKTRRPELQRWIKDGMTEKEFLDALDLKDEPHTFEVGAKVVFKSRGLIVFGIVEFAHPGIWIRRVQSSEVTIETDKMMVTAAQPEFRKMRNLVNVRDVRLLERYDSHAFYSTSVPKPQQDACT
jgi:hypothetical protein